VSAFTSLPAREVSACTYSCAMSDDDGGTPFGHFRMVGGRYDRPGLPVSSAMELFRYERLVKAVAHHTFLARNRGRRRVPRGFENLLELRLVDVARGSVVPVLNRSSRGDVLIQYDLYEEARRLINEALGELGKADPSLPRNFPVPALKEFAQFGRSLHDSEYIELSGIDEPPVVLSPSTRSVIQRLAQLESIEVESVLVGQITGLRSEPQQFDFSFAADGRKFVGLYVDPVVWNALHELQGYANRAPLASLSVVAKQGVDGEVLGIVDVLGVEAALPPAWAERVEMLTSLSRGWYQEESESPSPKAIDAAEELLFAFVDEDVPRPGIYPFIEGGVQFEWHAPGGGELELTFHNDGRLEAFSTAGGQVAEPDDDEPNGLVVEYNYDELDIDEVLNFVKEHVDGS